MRAHTHTHLQTLHTHSTSHTHSHTHTHTHTVLLSPLAVRNLWVRHSIRTEQRHDAHHLALLVTTEVVRVQELVASDGPQPRHALCTCVCVCVCV